MSNLQTVQEIYEAFGREDVAAVMDRCVDSPEWEYGETSTDVPWLQHQIGRDGAIANMVSSATELEIHNFVPKALMEGDGVVVALLNIEFTVKKTGKRVIEEDTVQILRFNEEGKVTHFRQRVDTHQQQLAWRS